MDAVGSMKDYYRDPLIAMSFFAVLFFIILVVILAVWCKKRRQTEVKTVVIQPKKRPISTKQPNGRKEHTSGNTDVEAGAVRADEIELSEGQDEDNKAEQSDEQTEEKDPSADTQQLTIDNEVPGQATGEINPSFQKDEDDTPAS